MAINSGADFYTELRDLRENIGSIKKDGTPYTHDDYINDRDKLVKKYSMEIPQLQLEGGKLVC